MIKRFLLCILLIACSAEVEVVLELDEPSTRPQFCQHLLKEDPGKWDPETDTYPRNFEWEKCMGVS